MQWEVEVQYVNLSETYKQNAGDILIFKEGVLYLRLHQSRGLK